MYSTWRVQFCGIRLYSIFFGAIDYSKTFDDNEPAIDDQSLNHRSKNCYIEFLKQITEVIKNSNKYYVFIGTANFIKGDILHFNDGKNVIYPINDINDKKVLYFSKGYRDLFINENPVQPSLSIPLPNGEFCGKYKGIANKRIGDGEDAIIVYREIAKEVSLRNGYSYDNIVSRKNSSSSKIRDIYTFDSKIYVSADIEHGGIEVFDNNGKHQGEYHYDGILKSNSKDKKGTHDIII